MSNTRTLEVPGYEVLQFIGSGARSTIWHIRDCRTKEAFALKRVVKRSSEDSRFLEQAINEYEVGNNLHHPVIRQIHSINRIKHAIQLKESDRVPVTIFPGMFPYTYAGMTIQEAMYNYDRCVAGYKKFVQDFKPDIHFGAGAPGPGRFYEILDYKLYAWPGHGVSPESIYQCLEGEYMKAEEYDLFITDPSFFFRNFYLPRVFGALEPWSTLPPLTGILEMYGVAFNFIPFATPPVQGAFKAIFEAGAEAMKWAGAVSGINGDLSTLGFPIILGGFTKAPFDTIGDTLRGTKGIMLDMFRQPDKLLHALEAITPIMISMGLGASQRTGNPVIFMPLHKGADGFLSDQQFKRFYWPTLRKVIMGLIEGGMHTISCG